MRYYAILSPGETLDECYRVCRDCPGGFEKYDFTKDAWVYDVDLFLIYAGEPEVEDITEAQVNEIIARVQKRIAGAKARNGRA